MTRGVASVPPTMSCHEALELLRARSAPCLLVEPVDGGAGVVDEAALVKGIESVAPDAPPSLVASVMLVFDEVVDPDSPLEMALEILRRVDGRHLPVCEGNSIIGTVSRVDIVKTLDLQLAHRIFAGLESEEIVALLRIASLRDVPENTVLLVEGSTDSELFVLDRGQLSVTTRRAGTIARIRPGEAVGELEIFGGVNAASVRADVQSRLLVVEREQLVALLAEYPKMAAKIYSNIARLLSARLREANRFVFLRGIARHRVLVLRALALLGVFFVLFTLGFAGASESPSFCRSCHYMQPYFDTWSVSTHRDVSCEQCHSAYGMKGVVRGKITGLAMVTRYATQTYDPRPEAEVSDGSCTRAKCHGQTSTIERLTSEPTIRFNHRSHEAKLESGWSLRCTSCHKHERESAHFSVSKETCYLCHLTELPMSKTQTECHKCHEFEPQTDSVQRIDHVNMPVEIACAYCHESVSSGGGVVEDFRCYTCHLETRQVSSPELHDVHVVQRDVDCFQCHDEIRHEGSRSLSLSQNCENCHPQQHSTQEQVYLGQGGQDVMSTPGVMSFFHVECTGCHRQGDESAAPQLPKSPAHGLQPVTDETCLTCHDVEYQDKMRMWRSTIDNGLADTRELLVEVKVGLDRTSARDSELLARARKLYEQASYNHGLVANDNSRGVHNFRYARDLLESVRAKTEEALLLLRG